MKAPLRHLLRLLGLLLICGLSLQLFFLMRVAAMRVVDPQSTSFQRSEAWRLLREQHQLPWSQEWVDGSNISKHLKRAVIASEDAGFIDHHGVEWEAIEKAWDKNQRAEARADQINERQERRAQQRKQPSGASPSQAKPKAQAKVVGGSTISQQLAKNLFLAGERTLVRKAQEIVITYMLETLLSKERILEIYLNSVEWGEGVFGAEAASRHYFRVSAAQLGAFPAARLAVMLPAPKRFEKRPASPYILGRASTVTARMADVELP